MVEKKVAIITGASQGIGEKIALTLAKNGIFVVLAARTRELLEEVSRKISQNGGSCLFFTVDVTDRNAIKKMVYETEKKLGHVDILVNNAGELRYTTIKNLHEEEWDLMIDVNCKGVLNCIASVIPGMTDRKHGHIINISSDAGRKGYPGLAVYSATKFFIEGLSQSLRLELLKYNIRVTSIQPGDTATDLGSLSTDDEAHSTYGKFSSDIILLHPQQIADSILFCINQPDHCSVNEILIQPIQLP